MDGSGMKRRIVYISGTRADYGLMRSVLFKINTSEEFELVIVATGMHLLAGFGNSIDEIVKDGFTISLINVVPKKDTRESMPIFIGKFLAALSRELERIHPDLILLLGDRGEMLAGAIAGTYLGIPIAHLHGGEITSTVDEPVRHAITKLANIHMAATEKSMERILLMGEDPAHVHLVGAPGLNAILDGRYTPAESLKKKYPIMLGEPFILCIQHPVSAEVDAAPEQMRETLEAIRETGYRTIVVYPNADAGGQRMISVIREYEILPFISCYRNLPHEDYLGLLSMASVLVGNSSSGIIEAASFHIPVVNIGTRQAGRERAINVIDVGYDQREIVTAIQRSFEDEQFLAIVRSCPNPYGDGKAPDKILAILKGIPFGHFDIQKQLRYK
jgi:UDP-hydrolysing UDP-N-acetyl-D-glucosamine 2-epimerase